MKNRPIKKSDLRVGLLVVSTNQPDANIWTIADFDGNAVYILGDGFERDGIYRPNHSSGWCDYSGFYHPTVEQIQAYLDEGRRLIDGPMALAEMNRVRKAALIAEFGLTDGGFSAIQAHLSNENN